MVTFYVQTLAVPARRNVDDPQVKQGEVLFAKAQCASCHVPTLRTGVLAGIPSVSNQTIQPFTDMLLHDMGPDLADNPFRFSCQRSRMADPATMGYRFGEKGLTVIPTSSMTAGRRDLMGSDSLARWGSGSITSSPLNRCLRKNAMHSLRS